MNLQTITVTELNNRIRDLLDEDPFLGNVCVRGELSNYKMYPSGHHYFSLKDSESQIKCVMYKGSAMRLRFRPENGMCVTLFGRVDFYKRDGACQLICTDIIPEGTGDLQIAFEQLKEKLSQEGLFDGEHKKPLPEFPQRIAIVTSSAGAAVHDMIRILSHRWPMSKILLLPVRVQGGEAPPEIVGAIRYANKYRVADLIITGRGGGSIEDLWAFNDERVARVIYESEIPVISAVGHEPDVTISDYVADVRASTPSNAAELAVPDLQEIEEKIAGYELRAAQAMRKKLQRLSDRLDSLKNKRVMTDPLVQIDNRRVQIDHSRDRLISAQERILYRNKQSFVRLAATMDAMSPLKVLGRGYAIAIDSEGTALRKASELKRGDIIRIRLNEGSADCTVIDIIE